MQNTMLDSTISNSLQLFQNAGFKVRVIMRCAEPWFVAKDVATCIEHSDTSAMCKLCRDKDKVVVNFAELKHSDDLSECFKGQQSPNLTLISESGLYRILAKCNLPKCEPFESWVFDEVLPSIRKTGSYSVNQTQQQPVMLPDFCNPAEAARAWADLYEKNQAAELRALTAESERDEAVRTKTQYQSNLAAQMSGRVGGLTTALNRVKLENDRLKGDRLTKDDVYIIMQTQGVSFTLKTVKDVIRESLNTISEYLDEPFPKITTGERTDSDGKTFEVKSFVYTRKTVQAFFEFVENNPLGWQARNRKFILGEWLHHGMTIPA